MALITLPSYAAYISDNESHLTYDNQIVIESEWSSRRRFLNKGYPVWQGNFVIAATRNEQEGLMIEGWLSGMMGQANTTKIPVNRPTITTSGSISSSAELSGVVTHTTSGTIPGLTSGMRVLADGRMYSVRSVAGTSVVLDPQRTISGGVMITAATELEVRLLSSTHPLQPRGPDFWGPWSVSWQEV